MRSSTDLGVQAVLLPHGVANNVAGWVDTGNARGTVLPLPVGDVGLEDNLLLRRHLARGPVAIEVEWQNEVSGPIQVSNVVAEVTSRELPQEWVLLGAHLDSWDLGTGALTKTRRDQLTPAQVVAELRKGNERFRTGKPAPRDYLEEQHADATGQAPAAVVLGRIDSRVPAEIVFDAGIGELFVARVAGNVVDEDILGSLEYARAEAGARRLSCSDTVDFFA